MLPSPHGGRLLNRQLSPGEVARVSGDLPELFALRVAPEQLLDASMIGIGAYSPLEGFMDRATLESVLTTGRLPSGLPWPIPVLLAPPGRANAAIVAQLRPGELVALLDDDGRFVARMRVTETFPVDRTRIAETIYGTTSTAHPNVAQLAAGGGTAIAGLIDLLRRPTPPYPDLELTPAGMRETFRRLGWERVAAFQTRSIPHSGHEQLQRLTLEREDVDGLLVHPVVGLPRPGEYRSSTVVAAYRALLDRYYPAHRVRLATLHLPMRFAGPKAALFLAIVRKNFGCSLYIVGRDQAGIDDRYDPYECHRIFDRFPIGVTPLRYRALAACRGCGGMVSDRSCPHPPEMRSPTNPSRIRTALAGGVALPEEMLRPEVLELLRQPEVTSLVDDDEEGGRSRPIVRDGAPHGPRERPTVWAG